MRGSLAVAVFVLLILACTPGGEEAEAPITPSSDPRPLDSRLVELGRQIYGGRCAPCHGANGEGAADWRARGADGALPPPPHNASGHTWHHADGLLYRVVRDGCAAYQVGSAPCNMPAFGDQLNDEEIRAVIEFMRTWWGPEERAFQQEVTRSDPFPLNE